MAIQAIDDQMENLTAGVGKALGSFWGGLGGAVKGAQSLASKVCTWLMRFEWHFNLAGVSNSNRSFYSPPIRASVKLIIYM